MYSILIQTGKGGREIEPKIRGKGATGEITDHKAGLKMPT